MIKLILPFPV